MTYGRKPVYKSKQAVILCPAGSNGNDTTRGKGIDSRASFPEIQRHNPLRQIRMYHGIRHHDSCAVVGTPLLYPWTELAFSASM